MINFFYAIKLPIVAIILSICVIRNDASNYSSEVVELAAHNFEDELGKTSILVMYYVPRCENCDDWNQLLDNLAQKMKHSGNNDVAIGKVDCLANKELCNEYASYLMSGKNRLCSYDRKQAIENAEDCKAAADSFHGKSFTDSRNKPMYPKGCYFLISNGRIYFNTDSTGSKSRHAEQICKEPDIVLENPKLKFFKLQNPDADDYRGPQTLLGLTFFVNEKMGRAPVSKKNESVLVLEAGCKKKIWEYNEDGLPEKFKWVADGELLDNGVCIDANYQKYHVPEKGRTKVNCTIEYQKIREVDAKRQTLSIDLLLTLKWLDPNIRTNIFAQTQKNEGIGLLPEATKKIWTPDLYIWNSTTLKSKEEWASLKKTKLSNIKIDESGSQYIKTAVEMKYEIKTTVYCNFQFAKYPADKQACSIKIGSGSEEAIFILKDENKRYHTNASYNAVGKNMLITFFGENNLVGKDTVGFHIEMTRMIKPYLMKYYIPCIATVLVSEMGFVIPLTAIPGRVALLVTQFLTLVNLFIYQMSESPSESEMTILGTYILVSLGFVAIAMIEFAFILLLNRRAMLKVNAEGDGDLMKSSRKNVNLFGSKSKLNSILNGIWNDVEKPQISAPKSHILDLVAFSLHFVSFLIFNIFYWNKYSN